ncbi:amidotransferase [Pseudomonas sp. NPDC007930]|uniref:amidotransferase n=1 Tax=Pseudomonas sp. NPDC007930 TaxID=3364417 RepID=UPI0036ED3F48
MSLRICILETDHIRPELVERYQGYGRMFEQLFERQPVPASFEIFNVVEGHYPPAGERYDAYLVTGSKADSFGSDPWIAPLKAFLLARYNEGAKLLGVCFGHQLLALLLGGKAERAHQGWGVGTHQYSVGAKASWMAPAADGLTLLISHQDQVTALPEGATVVASSAFCPFAAFQLNDQVLCFQGHPEFVHDYSRALLELRQMNLGEQVYKAAVDSLVHDHDGATVAEWMMRFVAQGK